MEYFKLENPKVVVVRLEMLLLSKCEDFAINLCKACLDTYSSLEVTLDFNQNEIDYITDIYFSSLMKNKRKLDLIAEVRISVCPPDFICVHNISFNFFQH